MQKCYFVMFLIILVFSGQSLWADVTYQAEDAETIFHGVVETEHTGHTGTGYVNLDNEIGSYIEWVVSAAETASQTVRVYYANGTTQDRPMEVILNSESITSNLSFIGTGAWTTWKVQTFTALFDEGANVLRMVSKTENGAPNIDKIEVTGGSGGTFYILNLSQYGEGTILREPGDSLLTPGAQVTLTAEAGAGYQFRKWMGDITATGNPITITMDTTKNITALFVRDDLQMPADDLIGWATYDSGTTGGTGGTVVNVSTLSELKSALTRSGAYIIQVQGTIEITPFGAELPVSSNKTILGLGTDATLKGGGLGIGSVSNIIVKNLTFKDAYVDWDGKTTDNDAIEINNSHHVWIDHCDFSHFDDGLIDIKNAADYVTVSWCHFHNHNKVMLIGAGDDATQDRDHLNTTVHHCWFDGTDGNGIGQRLPRVRYGKVHVFNNYMNDVVVSGVMVGYDGNMVVDNNYFLNVPLPHAVVGGDGGDNRMSASGNIYITSGSRRDQRGVTFDPAEYYVYEYDATEDVPTIVMLGAGVENLTAIEPDFAGSNAKPHAFVLEQNYPNPFNPATHISYTLPQNSHVKLEIFDLLGRNIATLVDAHQQMGRHTVRFEAATMSSGVYLYRITAGPQTLTAKMILMK